MPLLFTELQLTFLFLYFCYGTSLIFKYKMHLPIHKASMQGWIFIQQR